MKTSTKTFTTVSLWVLSMLFVFIAAIPARASTYYVAMTGNDANSGSQLQPFKTIRRGMNALKAGDRLYIWGGTYPEQISSYAQTIPTGTSWENAPLISAYQGESVILKPNIGREVISLARSYIQYVVFDGLILDGGDLPGIEGATYAQSFGINTIGGAHHVRFVNTEIKNAAGSGILLGDAGLSTYFEFINCNVHHNGKEHRDHGFYITTGGNRIKNCRIHDNAGWGIHIYTGSSINANNNVIEGNDIFNNAVFSGSAAGILFSSGNGNLAFNNIVRGNKNGIQVGDKWKGVSSRTKVYNNTIYQNTPGVGIDVVPTSTDTEIRNNIIYKNGGTILNSGTNTIMSNNVFTNPGFADEPNGNFKLQKNSSAINQGTLLSEVPYDLAGVIRPQLGAHDLGAYEYSSAGEDSTPPFPPQNVRAY